MPMSWAFTMFLILKVSVVFKLDSRICMKVRRDPESVEGGGTFGDKVEGGRLSGLFESEQGLCV